MDIQILREFFMWCTIFNVGLLLLWTGALTLAPELLYRTQRRWFPSSQEHLQLVMYGFLGFFKILVLVFNLVPYLALVLIG